MFLKERSIVITNTHHIKINSSVIIRQFYAPYCYDVDYFNLKGKKTSFGRLGLLCDPRTII